jgi:thiamine kinase-like enzyme
VSADARISAALAALEPVLGSAVEQPQPLGGGLTNHNYLVRFAGRTVVIRLAGDGTDLLGIDRDQEAAATRNAAELGIGPEVVAQLPEQASLVTQYVVARPLEPAEIRGARLEAVVAALRVLHEGPPLEARFIVTDVLRGYAHAARRSGVPVHPHEAEARAITAEVQRVLTGPEHLPCACHNDLLAANVLDDGERLWIVDWEYAGMNDRFFDLANLAVNNEFGPDDERALLAAYFGAADDRRLARLGLMRLVSDAREAHWGLVQAGASSLDFDFAGYADRHFARLAERAAGGRLEQLLAAA